MRIKDVYQEQIVFLFLGLFGFLFGMFFQPTWQRAIEFGQILSGVVQYPLDNVYYIYAKNSWASVNQIIAILLKLGISEKTLSYWLSGVMGAFAFLSLGMIFYSTTKAGLLSILIPLFIIVTNVYHGTGSAIYPLYLTGQVHTHGMLGYLVLFLIIGTFVSRKYSWAGFLIGIMPSVHIGIFILSLPVFILTGIFEFRDKDKFRPFLRGFSVGWV